MTVIPRNTLRSLRTIILMVMLAANRTHAAEQLFPACPIRFIVPNGAGVTTDLLARSVAPTRALGEGALFAP